MAQLVRGRAGAGCAAVAVLCAAQGLWVSAAVASAAAAAIVAAERHRLPKKLRLSVRQVLLLQLSALLLCGGVALLEWRHASRPKAAHSALRKSPLPSQQQRQQQLRGDAQWNSFMTKEEHPDLRSRTSQEIRDHLPAVFRDLPAQWDARYKNPCWADRISSHQLQCLPYAYILGMPKCGTTDLWARLHSHPEVARADRKEIRWFTRGEFSSSDNYRSKWTSQETLQSFTRHFGKAVPRIQSQPNSIVVDGGPHTLWWSVQSPTGRPTDDIPPPHLLHEMQPDAKFIVTLRDPVHRLYSDYYFLADDKSVARHNDDDEKSAQQFHDRVVAQIADMHRCIEQRQGLSDWFTASQICAHDRYQFGRAGWGRINIGMYIVFIAKWFELFKREQFLFLRMEDYDTDPTAHMRQVFEFLQLSEPSDGTWEAILERDRLNQLGRSKEPMLRATEKLLREFYQPYNDLLAQQLGDDKFAWRKSPVDHADPESGNAYGPEHVDDAAHSDKASVEEGVSKQAPDQDSEPLQLRPASFSLDKLPGPIRPPSEWNQFAKQLNLDVPSMDAGLAGRAKQQSAAVYQALKGQSTWVSEMLEPPLPKHVSDAYTKSIVTSLQAPIRRAGEWLVAAGVPVNAVDTGGHTALMLAAQGGLDGLVRLLLDNGADPNIKGPNGVTALHLAAIFGHTESARLLVEHGAHRTEPSFLGISFDDVVSSPGAISATDAQELFGVTQRPPRQLAPPSTAPNAGEWSTKRLKGFEDVARCDVDMLWASELDAESLWRNYIAQAKPVLIRGLVDHWKAFEMFKPDNMVAQFGEVDVHVSAIPYARKFDSNRANAGFETTVEEYLSDYMSSLMNHEKDKGRWYIFKPFRIPSQSEADDSPVNQDVVPVPDLLLHAFAKMFEHSRRSVPPVHSRMFVTAQWAVGGPGTGAPVHYHNTAWNALIYGAKLWYIYPPAEKIMSNTQILSFVENEVPKQRGAAAPMQCVQQAGDVMIIPESWAHGVLNIQDSVAVATEVRGGFFRITESTATRPSSKKFG